MAFISSPLSPFQGSRDRSFRIIIWVVVSVHLLLIFWALLMPSEKKPTTIASQKRFIVQTISLEPDISKTIETPIHEIALEPKKVEIPLPVQKEEEKMETVMEPPEVLPQEIQPKDTSIELITSKEPDPLPTPPPAKPAPSKEPPLLKTPPKPAPKVEPEKAPQKKTPTLPKEPISPKKKAKPKKPLVPKKAPEPKKTPEPKKVPESKKNPTPKIATATDKQDKPKTTPSPPPKPGPTDEEKAAAVRQQQLAAEFKRKQEQEQQALKVRQQELLAQAQEKIAKIAQSRDKVSPSKLLEGTSAPLPKAITSLQIDALPTGNEAPKLSEREVSYRDELAGRLKLLLKLPEYGAVKLKLTLERSGKVAKVVIMSAESQANQKHIEKVLPGLIFPSFGSNFGESEQYTFSITLSNE